MIECGMITVKVFIRKYGLSITDLNFAFVPSHPRGQWLQRKGIMKSPSPSILS